jgi:hypothetical protein
MPKGSTSKIELLPGAGGLMPVILATQKTEIRRIESQDLKPVPGK